MDAVIIGGGVIGLSCAAELAAAGVSVTVLEAGPGVGQGSSARANGGFRAQFSTVPNIAFSLFSIAAFEAMQEAVDTIGMRQTGYLLLTGTEVGARSLRAAHDLQRSLGVATEWLDPDRFAEHAPWARLEGLRAGTFHARDGILDPAGLVSALARRAAGAEASIETDAHVSAIVPRGGGFRVDHAGGSRTADVVINAAGADARAVARLLDSDIPVEPVRRNLAYALAPPDTHMHTPMVVDLDTGVLARRESTGGWVIGYANPADRPGRETSVDPRFFEDLARLLPNRFPACWTSRWTLPVAGRASTPRHPTITRSSVRTPSCRACSTAPASGDTASCTRPPRVVRSAS